MHLDRERSSALGCGAQYTRGALWLQAEAALVPAVELKHADRDIPRAMLAATTSRLAQVNDSQEGRALWSARLLDAPPTIQGHLGLQKRFNNCR